MRRHPHNASNARLLLICVLALLLTGCGRRIRAAEVGDQIASNKHRTATVNTPLFEVSATWTPVPWANRHGPIAFLIEITNHGEHPTRLEVDSIRLEDSFGRIHGLIPPDKLWRAFASTSSPQPKRTVLTKHRRTVRHYHYRCDGRPRYRVYTSFGGWGWPGGGPYEYDPYHDQRETARFLAQLLESVTIEPQHVVIGHVVFAYRPREDDQLTLRITLGPNEASPTTQPADQTTVSMVFEVR